MCAGSAKQPSSAMLPTKVRHCLLAKRRYHSRTAAVNFACPVHSSLAAGLVRQWLRQIRQGQPYNLNKPTGFQQRSTAACLGLSMHVPSCSATASRHLLRVEVKGMEFHQIHREELACKAILHTWQCCRPPAHSNPSALFCTTNQAFRPAQKCLLGHAPG